MKAIKIIFYFSAFLIIVVIGGAVAFVNFADPNDFKQVLQQKVLESTGRTLTLEGDIEWGFWPKIRLKAGPLSLSNAPGFSQQPFIAVQEIEFAVATFPLLKKQIEMDSIKLYGAEIHLEKNAEGVTNWDDLAGGKSAADGGDSSADGGSIGAIVLGGIDIQDAHITWSDAGTEKNIDISKINVSTGPLTFGEPIEFKLTLNAVSNKPELDSEIDLGATIAYNLDEGQYTIDPLALAILLRGKNLPNGEAKITASAKIDINLDQGTAVIDGLNINGLKTTLNGQLDVWGLDSALPSSKGHLIINGKDLAYIFKVLELPVASQLGKIKDRSFEFDTEFDANMATGKVSVPKLKARLLGAQISAELEAQNAHTDKPAAKGNLQASGPNLPALIAVAAQLQGTDADTLKNLNAALAKTKDKSFSIDVQFDADMDSGDIKLPKLQATLLGNTLKGTLESSGSGPIKGQINASGPNMPALIALAAPFQGADSEGLKSLTSILAKVKDKSFSIVADLDIDLDQGRYNLPKISAKIMGNKISGHVSAVQKGDAKPAVNGRIKAEGPDLPTLLAIGGMVDLAKGLASAKNKSFFVDVEFDADMAKGNVELKKLSAKGLGLTISGKLNATDLEKGGNIEGRLGIKGNRLGSLLSAFGQGDLAKSLKAIDLDVGLKGSASDISLSPLSLIATVAPPKAKKTVEIKLTVGTARVNMDKQTLTVKDLAVTGLGLNLKANINATEIQKAPKYTGDIKLAPFDLRKLMTSLNQTLPPMAGGAKVLRKVGLDAKLRGTNNSISLDKLKLTLDGTTLSGNLAINDFTKVDTTFKLNIDQINADLYLAPAPKGKARPPSPEAAAAGATQLPIKTLQSLKIKGSLTIGKLQISGAKMQNIRLGLNADKGDIRAKPIAAELYKGKYTGDISINAKGKTPKLKINTTLKGVDIEPLLRDTTGSSDLSGTASFTAAISTVGKNSKQLMNSLTGTSKFRVDKGIFRGFDVPAILRQAEIILESRKLGTIPQGGQTDFERLTGSLVIKNGAVNNRDLVLKGTGFRVTGKGLLVNLRTDDIKYNLTLSVDKSSAKQGTSNYNLGDYKIPLRCRGKVTQISKACRPDYGGLLKAVAKKAVKDKINDVIKDKLKDLFKF